ncbi:2Fe-2S iron-sulfur cluster-binding protein [Bradyrhizobium brasilense]|uniref:2Fe-2S iron-sulfur cluster-binding protein n=1 Tax=Bradyrhizobium brasilense TaxID=1419277 RepID=UPI001E392A68|nr:2Fe-2S iron-sulfur cluster-binding protein [Bradyrhizobium brasilense]MCC8971574.1 (2Fe-2S)-binding protein [Bradyrhizobium brasilense]
MSMIRIVTRDGTEVKLATADNGSLMELLRNGGIDEIQAICGGCCSCATCHVYVREGADRLAPMTPDEDAMLGGSMFREPTSRLSCQLLVSEALDGLVVQVAPEE